MERHRELNKKNFNDIRCSHTSTSQTTKSNSCNYYFHIIYIFFFFGLWMRTSYYLHYYYGYLMWYCLRILKTLAWKRRLFFHLTSIPIYYLIRMKRKTDLFGRIIIFVFLYIRNIPRVCSYSIMYFFCSQNNWAKLFIFWNEWHAANQFLLF